MNKWTAREWVAILLAASVLLTLLGNVVFALMMQDHNDVSTAALADLLKVITGGLIGYIAGRNGNGNGKGNGDDKTKTKDDPKGFDSRKT